MKIKKCFEYEISVLAPADEPAWQDYVRCHPNATIYHTLEWRDILYAEYRFEPIYRIAKDRGKVVGILPAFLVKNFKGKRLVSLPFSIYGGGLGDSNEVISLLISKEVEMVKEGKVESLEIRQCYPVIPEVSGLAVNRWGIAIVVDLTVGIDELWRRLAARTDVRKSFDMGLKFILSDGDRLQDFYRLQLMTRKKLGLPTPRFSYYASFFQKFPEKVKLAIVEKKGVPIAGEIYFLYKDVMLRVLNASDPKALSDRPNDFIIWNMMEWGSANGINKFDHGPTSLENEGLLFFKRKWGGEERKVERYFFPETAETSDMSQSDKFANALLKVSPTWFHKLSGRQIIKRFG